MAETLSTIEIGPILPEPGLSFSRTAYCAEANGAFVTTEVWLDQQNQQVLAELIEPYVGKRLY